MFPENELWHKRHLMKEVLCIEGGQDVCLTDGLSSLKQSFHTINK